MTGARAPTISDVSDKVVALFRRGRSPVRIAGMQNLTVQGVVEILTLHGFAVPAVSYRAPLWEMDANDARLAITRRAASGARERLRELEADDAN